MKNCEKWHGDERIYHESVTWKATNIVVQYAENKTGEKLKITFGNLPYKNTYKGRLFIFRRAIKK